jgi:arylsulfatase A-like enzyme
LIPISGSAFSAATGPDFLFIYTDDMRWDAMSVVQQERGESARFPWFKTPHLDQLAAEGVRFRNAMIANAVCSLSRAEFLTGRSIR